MEKKKVSRRTMAWRMAAITLVVTIAFIGVCSEPQDSLAPSEWWAAFWTSKIIGAAFATLAAWMYRTWQIGNVES